MEELPRPNNAFESNQPLIHALEISSETTYSGPIEAEIAANFQRYGPVAATFTALKVKNPHRSGDVGAAPLHQRIGAKKLGVVIVNGSQPSHSDRDDKARNVKYITNSGVVIANGSGRAYLG